MCVSVRAPSVITCVISTESGNAVSPTYLNNVISAYQFVCSPLSFLFSSQSPISSFRLIQSPKKPDLLRESWKCSEKSYIFRSFRQNQIARMSHTKYTKKQLFIRIERKHLSVYSSAMFPNISILQSLKSSTRHLRKYGASLYFFLFLFIFVLQITTVLIIWTLRIINTLPFCPKRGKGQFCTILYEEEPHLNLDSKISFFIIFFLLIELMTNRKANIICLNV